MAQFRTALTLSPDYIGGHVAVGELLLEMGRAEDALKEMQSETDETWRLAGLAMTYHALGREAESDAQLHDLIRKYEKTASYSIAAVFAYRNEVDRAYEWLDKASQYHDSLLGSLAVYGMFANLHSDPRWLPFLRKHGMAPDQLAAIKFDVKVPE